MAQPIHPGRQVMNRQQEVEAQAQQQAQQQQALAAQAQQLQQAQAMQQPQGLGGDIFAPNAALQAAKQQAALAPVPANSPIQTPPGGPIPMSDAQLQAAPATMDGLGNPAITAPQPANGGVDVDAFRAELGSAAAELASYQQQAQSGDPAALQGVAQAQQKLDSIIAAADQAGLSQQQVEAMVTGQQ